tara:strand:+ start:553 stop:771 length:219 start_codon:yes stop_codon:yes gene_type:complete
MTTAFKMTNKARFAARSLAVRYDAFNSAKADGDNNGIALWGNLLIEAQEKVGVELYRPDFIRPIVARARAAA